MNIDHRQPVVTPKPPPSITALYPLNEQSKHHIHIHTHGCAGVKMRYQQYCAPFSIAITYGREKRVENELGVCKRNPNRDDSGGGRQQTISAASISKPKPNIENLSICGFLPPPPPFAYPICSVEYARRKIKAFQHCCHNCAVCAAIQERTSPRIVPESNLLDKTKNKERNDQDQDLFFSLSAGKSRISGHPYLQYFTRLPTFQAHFWSTIKISTGQMGLDVDQEKAAFHPYRHCTAPREA